MRGSIRTFVGLFLVWGAVGGLDLPENSLLACSALALVGLLICFSGVVAMRSIK